LNDAQFERIGAVAAIYSVEFVRDQLIVAGAAEQCVGATVVEKFVTAKNVVAWTAVEKVEPGSAGQMIISPGAKERVISTAAVRDFVGIVTCVGVRTVARPVL
jgi:hypothetical protein